MTFTTYKEYVEAATEYFSNKPELKIPVEYMIFSEELFNLFNGNIEFVNPSNCCAHGQSADIYNGPCKENCTGCQEE